MNNKSTPELVIMIGPPGAGKSHVSKERYRGYTYLSSDEIRKELFNDINYQGDNGRVFYEMRTRAIEELEEGRNVVYDATNMSRKDREGILKECPVWVNKVACVVWAPINDCVLRDAKRDRTVGLSVIKRMLMRYEAPFWDEGFDDIVVIMNTINHEWCFNNYYDSVFGEMHIPHDNPHHTYDIYQHSLAAAEHFNEEYCDRVYGADADGNILVDAGFNTKVLDIYFAILYHDIGKPFVKTFTNKKGETTDVAHYYGHAGVGAWMSYGLLGEFRRIYVPYLISHHMDPYLNTKYYQKLPEFIKVDIDILHQADLSAH